MDQLQRWSGDYGAWLMNAALPLWWEKGADRKAGGFHESLNPDGTPSREPRRAVVQARQSYSFAVAGALGWSGPWQEAAQHGLDYLNNRYKRADGLFCTLVSPDGAVVNETAMLFDQAFALLASAWVYKMVPARTDLKSFARTLMERIEKTMRHSKGGFRESGAHPFMSMPHMHLLEAALAWEEVDDAYHWNRIADECAKLCLDRFIDADPLLLREIFDERWHPVSDQKIPSITPGLHFEWSWLIERWARLRGREEAHGTAQRLFEVGAQGVESARNVAMEEMGADFSVRRTLARTWPQTERLKSALLFAKTADPLYREFYLENAVAAASALWKYLETPLKGLWRDKMLEDGSFVEEAAPAGTLYHIIGAVKALREAAEGP